MKKADSEHYDIEISKYGMWFFGSDTTEKLTEELKAISDNLEIKDFDYFETKLKDKLNFVIDRIGELTNKDTNDTISNISRELFYRFYYNRFLYYLTLDVNNLPLQYEYDFEIRGVFVKFESNKGFSLDRIAVDRWLGEEFTIPHLLVTLSKSINSKWLNNWIQVVMKGETLDSQDSDIVNPVTQIEDVVKKDLIDKIKYCRDKLITEKNRQPYALSQICKKMNELFYPIKYTTLRDKMTRHDLPLNIKKFTEIYG